MSMTATLHWRGARGVHDRAKGPSYTAVWRVVTTNPQDQAQNILNWFRANVVALNTPYHYAADTSGSFATATRIAADRDLNSTDTWFVVVDYESPDDTGSRQGVTESGQPSWNPIEWRPQISSSTVQYSRPVEKAEFLGGYTGKAALAIPVGHLTVPQSSALVPFDPPLERDASRSTVKITRNLASYDSDQAEAWADRTNQEGFRIQRFGFIATFPPLTAKIREMSGDLRFVNEVEYWEVSCTIDRKRETWVDEVPDRGVLRRALPGDPDGRGGTFQLSQLQPGMPRAVRITDRNLEPITESVLLNGDGQPRVIQEPVSPTAAVYGRWLGYSKGNFFALPFLQGIIQAL